MSANTYLIVHKDHWIDLSGVNSGAETATLWLARTLASMGNRVVVAAQLRRGEECWNGVEFWDLGGEYDVQSVMVRARTLKQYHLIAACRALPLLISRSERACASRFFIAHDPSAGALGIKPEVLCNFVDGVICVSEAQKGLFVQEGGNPEKITVIPNGADGSVFHPHTATARDVKRIVFAGALVVDKGVDILLRAFQHVKAAHPDAKLDIYGSSAMWGREPLFNQEDIERTIAGVRFHGSKPQVEIAEAFRTGAACVIPSRWFDSFPLTAVEAQACGCPVVAFDVGGVKESFVPGQTGILVPEVSEQGLAQALITLLSSPMQIDRMSKAAIAIVEQKFSWKLAASRIESLCAHAVSRVQSKYCKKKLGVLTTWNQQCGLATYARYLFSQFDEEALVVFSEEGKKLEHLEDEAFVERCWSRKSTDFGNLKDAVSRNDIGLLHINVHDVKFFQQPAFGDFLGWVKSQEIKVMVHLHSTFTRDKHFAPLIEHADKIIVHSDQNRLEVIANGATPHDVLVLPHGVDQLDKLSDVTRKELRAKLGMPAEKKVLLAFGFVQPHKGMEGVLEAVLHLRAQGRDIVGFIVGNSNPDDSGSVEYQRQLKQLAAQHNLHDSVVFVDRFVSDQEVSQYLQAADIVLMNYRSQHYEASGACSLAVGAGAVVATSGAPPFIPFGEAVWHLTSGYPPALAVDLLLSNTELFSTLKENAAAYAKQYSWPAVAEMLRELYRAQVDFVPTKQPVVVAKPRTSTALTSLNVLLQNRQGTFTQRGGDTIVLERTRDALQKLGVTVTVDVEGKEDPSKFDLVHLFNFATPDLTKALGERAQRAGVPFVVTTLLEDVATFFNQGLAAAQVLIEYVSRKQDLNFWKQYRGVWNRVQPSKSFDNEWLVKHAAALLTNGSRESATVTKYHPNAKNIHEVPLGHEVGADGDPKLFIDTYGVKDFVLCVGRLESRKNQLMLLRALENVEVPVVLVGGGFTYQPEYADAVQKFQRRGKTLVLGRLSAEMLASAYAAAKVHALPSWYELPGLVSLEAASHGCAVVVTDHGTARDYFGDLAHYCDPGDEESVRTAVEKALITPVNPKLRSVVQQFRWDAIGKATLTVYERILGRKPMVQEKEGVIMTTTTQSAIPAQQSPVGGFGSYDLSSDATEFQDLVERGEIAAKSGEFAKAHELLAKAEEMNPISVRMLKARGTVLLAESKEDEAKRYFERAWTIDPKDARVLCGLGICEMRKERAIEAYRYFVDALAISPESQVAILQLIPVAYTLGKYDDLERALRRYVENHADDSEMEYCLGGCLYKMGRHEEACDWAKRILARQPANSGAKELLDLASKMIKPAAAPVQTVAPVQVTAPVQVATPVVVAPVSRPSVAQAVERVVIPSAPQVMTSTSASNHNSIDLEIGEIEDAKRNKKVEEVKAGVAKLLSNSGISADQKEILLCLKAEVGVLEGNIKDAQEIYLQILDVNPSSARAIAGRAVIAAHENRWDEARALFERANSFRPNYDLALAGLGLCAWNSGDFDAAWERFTQALKVNPENTRALLGLVQIGYPKQRFNEIATAIEGYLDLHPADLEWTYSLAGCYFALNKLDEATDALDRIRLFKPEHEKANELTAMIAEKRQGGGAGIGAR